MAKMKRVAIVLELPIWGLPEDIDVEALTMKACSVAETLESLGCYNQREFTPVDVFSLTKVRV